MENDLTLYLLYTTIVCFFFIGLSVLVSANLDDYKWDICNNVNLTGSNCDNFWDDFKTNLSGYFNYSDTNMTYNITVEYHYNQTYGLDPSNFTDALKNFTYNKTDVNKMIDSKTTNFITTTETDNKINTLDTKLANYVLISELNNSIPKEQTVKVELPAFWKYFITFTFIGMLGIILTIFLLWRMED